MSLWNVLLLIFGNYLAELSKSVFCLIAWILDIDFLKFPNFVSLTSRSSHPEVYLGKGILKLCHKFTGEQPCRKVISIKLQSNFIKITLRHGCSPVNLLHIFRTLFPKNTSGRLLLHVVQHIVRQVLYSRFGENILVPIHLQ